MRAGKCLSDHGYKPRGKLWKLFASLLRGIIPSAMSRLRRDSLACGRIIRSAYSKLRIRNMDLITT